MKIIVKALSPNPKTSMAVLGMHQSGKTTFYNYLRDRYDKETTQTNVEEVEEITLRFPNNRTVIIKAGKDIGGEDDYVRPFYLDLIAQSDVVLFLFNLAKYTDDKQYARHVKARLTYINCHWKADTNQRFYLIITHKDMLTNEKDAFKKTMSDLYNSFSRKDGIGQYLQKGYTIVLNMTSIEDLDKLKNGLFNKIEK